MSIIHQDIIIIGAGLSGIGAACHLCRKNPEKSYLILEARAELGGTWSLFKYPGIRSDSDMYTFGYSFKTWENPKSFADAPSILKYLEEAADEFKVKEKIVYQQKVLSFNFDTKDKLWTITTTDSVSGKASKYTANFIFNCTGYYNYEEGYTPDFKGYSDFKGEIIHPQKWPKHVNLVNKKVVIIGSGATAVTIVPKVADEVEQVTMLQRSPTYIGAVPNEDKIAAMLKSILSAKSAHRAIRVKNVLFAMFFFTMCRSFPKAMKKLIIAGAKKELGDFPFDPHFIPNYNPWEQRFCMAPDGDFFKAIRSGKASVVTDHIDCFVENGIQLKSGKTLEADIIITATGLKLLAFGGVSIQLDNKPFDISKSFVYKGVMMSDLPNFFAFIGYTNASWTLKSDLTSEYISRIFNYLEEYNYKAIQARVIEDNLKPELLMNLNSGYINRSANELPSQGNKAPWRVYQNYIRDYKMLRIDKIDDGRLLFF